MTSEEGDITATLDEKFQFKDANVEDLNTDDVEQLKSQIEYLRRLNNENVSLAQQLKEKYKVFYFVYRKYTNVAVRKI